MKRLIKDAIKDMESKMKPETVEKVNREVDEELARLKMEEVLEWANGQGFNMSSVIIHRETDEVVKLSFWKESAKVNEYGYGYGEPDYEEIRLKKL